MRPILIGNPNAGFKAGLTTNAHGVDDAVAALRRVDLDPIVRLTGSAGDGSRLARAAVAAGHPLIIAAGGDGTVEEVAQALVGTPATLGIMPLGSVMNLARTLGIPRELDAAARVIVAGQALAMDVGAVHDRYFLEYASVGIDAALRPLWERFEEGDWAVARILVRALFRYRPRAVTVRVDDRDHRVHALMIVVANTPFYGWGFPLHPDAQIDDGCFEIKIFDQFSALELLAHGVRLRLGRHPRHPKIRELRGRVVAVNGDRPLPVHADMRPAGRTPVCFRQVPRSLRVLRG